MAVSGMSANQLLAMLPVNEQEQVAEVMHAVPLRQGEVLFEESSPPGAIWFPVSGAVSLLTTTIDGEALQTSMTGVEGAIGVSLALAAARSPQRVEVDINGAALRLESDVYLANQARLPALQRNLLRYADFLTAAMGHWATCHAYHRVDQRCAGWLLNIARISARTEFRITHEQVATIVGAQRPPVSVALQSLRASGFIEYRRGALHVLNPAGLGAVACLCHEEVARHYTAVFGTGLGAPDPPRSASGGGPRR